MANKSAIHVEVVFAPCARTTGSVALELEAGSTAAQALECSRLLLGLTVQDVDSLDIGVWGRKVALGHVLRDRDRIEIYRPLKVDPKVARRERFTRQGARKTAGLFARRREGAKSGY